jgi:hypothetical protein
MIVTFSGAAEILAACEFAFARHDTPQAGV